MARATRSTAAADPPPTPTPPSPPKKRKRHSSPGAAAEDPPQKHARVESEPPSPSAVAAVPLSTRDAQAILDVLEMTDTQGLLDRVFPLQHSSAAHSLRALLSSPAEHPLRVLRAAVQNLLPLATHPRARPSATAAQQLRFCNLALDLLDQASRNVLPVSLSQDTLFPEDDPAASPKSPSRSPVLAARRYALVQHLPSADYWSSLNIGHSAHDLKHLSTAHADLVAVLPSASSISSKPPPTLATYHPRQQGPKKMLPAQRRVPAAKFLDYGPWASFAPAFDHDMELVGRRELGDVLFQREQRMQEMEHARREIMEGRGSIVEEIDVETEQNDKEPPDVDAELDGLLPEEDVKAIKVALGNLQLETAVQDLLEKNYRALDRLEELQIQRLTKEGGGSSVAEEGSEEWDTAQSIMDSLTVLSSLRPRPSSGEEQKSLVPPPSVLRKLHRTLALEPSPGWYGTLPATRATALRDDSTVKVRPGASAPATVPTPTPIAPAPAPAATAATAPAYAAYSYNYAAGQQPATVQQPYRPQSAAASPYTPYKPGPTTSYYQNYVPPATQQQTGYYSQQSYAGAAAASGAQPYATTNQQPYAAYSNWYSQYPTQMGTTGTPSSSGTPQPLVTTPATYGTFFNTTAGTATPPPAAAGARTPAVANTVMANKTAIAQPVPATATTATSTWTYAQPTQPQQQGAVPTLPPHLRNPQQAGGAAQTYQQAVPGYPAQQATTYYGQYQSQPPSAPTTPAAR